MSKNDLEKYEIVGIVETSFETTRRAKNEFIAKQSYDELLTLAKSQYDEDIDVMDIILEKKSSKRNLWYIAGDIVGHKTVSAVDHFVTVHTKGVVVRMVEE